MTPRRKPGLPQVGIDRETMRLIADALDLRRKLTGATGWTFRRVSDAPAHIDPSRRSYILIHFVNGRQIATSHHVVRRDGSVSNHWHVKDILLSGTKFVEISTG